MNDERYERFAQAVGDLDIDHAAARERWLGRVGVAAMIVGVGLGVVAYLGSTAADGPLAQRDMIVLGLLGVSVTVLGVGLFLRYSMIRFFRFWAARMTYEIGRSQSVDGRSEP